jgi:DNA repair exonuclease SbcCD ATPase subunit/DNA repair exonuclease SbcCD nuclease subunit
MVLSHIFHLSDLHIRNGDNTYSRYKEYKDVFKETITSIKNNIEVLNLSFDNFIIVITGDIFHNKNVIGNYGLIIYRKLIQALSSIGRTYIISGNHDYDQSDVNKPSLVYSSTFAIPNVFVLNNTTSFTIDDVGISFVSIDKTLDIYRNSGRIQDLPPFPTINKDVKYKLALFHGSFASAKLYNGKSIEETFNPYPLEWVSDFDYVLLGDIHKRQVFIYKNKTICGYAGSLIQQNFGEDIINHGYLIWDLYNKDIKKVNVYNDKGFINIKEDDNNEILIRINGKYERKLEDYIKSNEDIFPKNIDIKNFSNINIFNLNTILQKYNINYIITEKPDGLNNINNINNINNLVSYNKIGDIITNNVSDYDINVNNDVLTDYFKPLLSQDNLLFLNKIIKNKEILLIDVDSYPEELRDETLKLNKELSAIINASLDANENTIFAPKSLFKIKYLEWEGLLCYENKNWLNMNELERKIFMVKGKNGTGKSAIYDILLLAIWGENTKKCSLSSGVINHNKNKGYTIIDIELNNNETYRIVRNYSKKNIGNKLQVSSSVLYKYLDNDERTDIEIIKKDSACNNEIQRLLGSIDDFLSTSMITQSVDCDILKMDFKSILELIDRSFNIEYIYHLYNVFNKTINKYKGLHKYVDSKKDVYVRLINSKNNQCNEEELAKIKEDLEVLSNNNCILKDEYDINNKLINNTEDGILIDANIILKIDCFELKNKINYDKLVSKAIYDNKCKRFAELEYILKGKNIESLSKQYDASYDKYNNNSDIINKPCELSVIKNEEEYLKEYFELFDENYYGEQGGEELQENIDRLKCEYDKLEDIIKQLIVEKPNKTEKIDKPIKTRKKCLNDINSIFGSLENLDEIINVANVRHINNSNNENCDIELSLENYNINLENRKTLENNIRELKINIEDTDVSINNYYKERECMKEISIPYKSLESLESLESGECKKYHKIIKEIESIDYNYIIKFLKSNEETLNNYNDMCEKIKETEEERLKYSDELSMLENNEEYHYNPECHYCCKRNWVKRIKELQIIIKKYDDDINSVKKNNDNDKDKYNALLEKTERFIKKKERYELLLEWRDYLKYKEEREKINNNIKQSLENKKTSNNSLINFNIELENVNKNIEHYHNKAIRLRELLNTIRNYEKYKKWEEKYTEHINKSADVAKELAKYTSIAEYNKNIKPRIISYRALLENYNRWEEYDNKINIINSKEYIDNKDIIDNYKNNELYNKYIKIIPIVRKNIELKEYIIKNEKTIRDIGDLLAEKQAIFNYNMENLENLNKLQLISTNIENTLSLLDTIIINFQDFRINLYDKIILNKLLANTNKMLKNISHCDTKPFELDYIINVSRDIIHINWLIKNISINNSDKQVISIHQASGYQQFVISLALRLCLFGNKTTCKQLFIDEGFVSFDKYNLSIVPDFLKSLLSYFDSIIIVSHIDLIQDTIEDNECIAEINYNNNTAVSSINYNKQICCKIKNAKCI